MKKLTLTIAIVLGMTMTTFADGGGLFHRSNSGENGSSGYSYYDSKGTRDGDATPGLPGHGQTGNQDAPLGTGIALMTALGAAYLVGKKRREE